MADSTSLVKSSYDDVNSALENLLGNMSEAGSSVTIAQVNQAIAAAVNTTAQVPVWMPIPSPSATTPAGYIPANGASFSATQYPQLGAAFPSGSVPDLRGLFIRGLDTTGVIDNVAGGRTLLSVEEGSRITGEWSTDLCSFNNIVSAYGSSRQAGMQALGWDIPSNQNESFQTAFLLGNPNASHASYNDDEILGITRPKNMAWNYVFRAA